MKYFSDTEKGLNEGRYEKMDENFLLFLDELREAYGKPIKINSSYRNANRNEIAGGVSNSAHTEIPCKAVDIHCPSSSERFKLVTLALELGCIRIGIGETFIHLDFSAERPNPRMWTYYK